MTDDYDPAIQGMAVLDSLNRLRTVTDRFAWGNNAEYDSLRKSYESIIITATGMAELPSEVAKDMRGSAYELIDAMDEMADDLEMVMERVPGLRREPSA